eukprot:CAMPEP_0206060128 /NCGR_PEP_ID=MMETSP1466-20131121/50530_1 /ASSEMBLY_ACC=CAM_ASM_001126 /TAXON_ID=44452 /ORGANISM="Pavlova gyrans, Strain CCMP608" /LENGTH=493 /DNA_ID=CAMNT_0053435461 /DNA_START=69 /DNA_END=1550 /DNA_ORIENTATION=+
MSTPGNAPSLHISAQFTLTSALLGAAGGIVIALATSMHLLLRGRITGISGICQGISSLSLAFSRRTWRLAFLIGMVIGACLMAEAMPTAYAADALDPTVSVAAVAGVLVGVGTKLGSGCTSGHGVCGLPRFSKRSFTSVLTFCFVGAATAVVMSASGLRAGSPAAPSQELRYVALALGVACAALLFATAKKKDPAHSVHQSSESVDVALSLAVGIVFAVGLSVAQMTRPSRVVGFLDPTQGWDPTLAFVLFSAVLFNLCSFRYILRRQTPIMACEFEIPTNKDLTVELVGGAVIFGAGWGLSGLCPGPAVCVLAAGKPYAIAWAIPFIVGQAATERVQAAWAARRATAKHESGSTVRVMSMASSIEFAAPASDDDLLHGDALRGSAGEYEPPSDLPSDLEGGAREHEGATSVPGRELQDDLGRVLRREMSESGIRRPSGATGSGRKVHRREEPRGVGSVAAERMVMVPEQAAASQGPLAAGAPHVRQETIAEL